jgi:hypothetical protein
MVKKVIEMVQPSQPVLDHETSGYDIDFVLDKGLQHALHRKRSRTQVFLSQRTVPIERYSGGCK